MNNIYSYLDLRLQTYSIVGALLLNKTLCICDLLVLRLNLVLVIKTLDSPSLSY